VIILRETLAFMWFAKTQIETVTLPVETRAEQLEQVRHARREAKAAFDASWIHLQNFLQTHPPTRRPFALNNNFYVPVNLLQSIPAKQRDLENQVARAKARWATLQKQEADFEFAHGLKR
jgi:hypothetical protein